MKYRSFSAIVVVALSLMLGLAAAAAPVAMAQDSNVAPSVGGPGSTFAFFATGFDDDATVGYWVNAPDGTILEPDENGDGAPDFALVVDGRADWTWTTPGDAMGGTWLMVAQGRESGRQVAIPFEVDTSLPSSGEPGAPASGDSAVQPAVGTRGTVFSFFATGFDDDNFVGYWLNAPDGSVITDTEEYTALPNEDGRVDIEWRAPGDAMSGTWQMVIRGASSNQEQVIPFEIR